MARPGCPPSPSRVARATTFRQSVEALERRIARSGDPAQESLLATVRGIRNSAEALENRAKIAREILQARQLEGLRTGRYR